jgi:hypothetical protein
MLQTIPYPSLSNILYVTIYAAYDTEPEVRHPDSSAGSGENVIIRSEQAETHREVTMGISNTRYSPVH